MSLNFDPDNWLVVGLGNPGTKYAKTRHNLGFMVVDELANRGNASVAREECRSLIGRIHLGGTAVEIAKPQTLMNLSGEAVECLTDREGRSAERLVIISDDLALPFGTIRIRPKGSHGGQNGLRSIIDRLNTQEFIRLRLGIAPEHPVGDAARFVLDDFGGGDAETVTTMVGQAADAVEAIITDGIEAAMAKFN
jgi:peptidyl-tRNA hydrolase, PTH1 family